MAVSAEHDCADDECMPQKQLDCVGLNVVIVRDT
jgi:hypothetical protein